MACSKLAASIAYNCDTPPVTGLGDRLILIPFDDVDKALATFDATNKLLLTNLVMKSGKHGYSVQGFNFSNSYDTALAKGTYLNSYEHNVTFRVFDKSAETKKTISDLTNTRVIAVIENRVSTGDEASKFEICGWDLGLEVTELTRNQSDADTGGGYVIALKADTQNKEPKLPLTFYKTDAATTLTAIEALLA